MIVGLCGAKNAGKDTVAAHLIREYGFERRAFADKLKQSIAELFGITFEQIEEFKNNSDALVTVSFAHKGYTQTFRRFMQQYGTEAHRSVFGNDFWLDQCLPVEGFYAGRKIVVTDCRFENELFRVNKLGGYVVMVDRPSLENQDPHSSEQEWRDYKYDAIILNDGTIDDLLSRTDDVMETLMEADY